MYKFCLYLKKFSSFGMSFTLYIIPKFLRVNYSGITCRGDIPFIIHKIIPKVTKFFCFSEILYNMTELK